MYISDHGESLGRMAYLHGMPYSLSTKKNKPTYHALWMSDGFAAQKGIKRDPFKKGGKRSVVFSQMITCSTPVWLNGRPNQRIPQRQNQDIFAPCR
ncbi:hypothetical protein O9929_13725 [Vibrio lentus]|nr:hypothetical protein [Vibrio lentus]